MKITSKEIRDCTNPDNTKTQVLELFYTHKWEKGRILVKDYDDSNFDVILKALRIEVRNQYNLTKTLWA
jgi:hypothetical protein